MSDREETLSVVSAPVAFADVDYRTPDGARAACVVASAWSDAASCEERYVDIETVAPYRPGAFYERELPCLLAVLASVTTPYRMVVVDGYVDLDAKGTPGLGARLFEALGGRIPIVGVAKTAFRGATFATSVLRGSSRKPLYLTARGIDVGAVADLVRTMHGPFRLPTLLGRVDHLARGWPTPEATT